MINVATDGACKGNPGPGGWGVAIFDDDNELMETGCGGELNTTNNRMELTAFIMACIDIDTQYSHEDVTIHIDSMYVLKGATEWLRGWRAKDYKGVKNEDLWRRVADLRHVWLNCEMKWVKGHSGDVFNEMADEMANKGCSAVMLGNDDW